MSKQTGTKYICIVYNKTSGHLSQQTRAKYIYIASGHAIVLGGDPGWGRLSQQTRTKYIYTAGGHDIVLGGDPAARFHRVEHQVEHQINISLSLQTYHRS
jgi:hypothetical protein